MWNLKYDTNELIFETETDSQAQKTDMWLPTGRGVDELDWKSVISGCKLVYIEWINKALLYSTGNYLQHPVKNHNEKEHEKECICMYT